MADTDPSTGSFTFKEGTRPFAHQLDTLRRILADRGVHALLHEPGCGKSRVVVDYAGILATGLSEVRLLALCPRDVQDTWLDQFRQFLPGSIACWIEIGYGSIADKTARVAKLGTDERSLSLRRGRIVYSTHEVSGPDELPTPRVVAYVTNFEAFSNRTAVRGRSTVSGRLVDECRKANFDLLVVDESHRLKSPSGNASRAIAKLAADVPRRLLLTGTPMPHSVLDVYSQWRVLAPDTWVDTGGRPLSFGRWARRFAVYGGWQGREVTAFQRLDELERIMARRSSVVRKEDALDLPPTMHIHHRVELGPRERAAYRAMADDLVTRLENGELTSAQNRLVQYLRLRQIAAGYVVPDGGAPQDLEQSKISATVSLVTDLMASEHRLVVFGWGRHEVDSLAASLRASPPYGATVELITGDTPDATRRAIRARFVDVEGRPDRLVLVAQIRTMSLGINELVTASHAVFLSLSAQRDDYIQALGRLDRPGQTKPVTYHHLLSADTVDEVLLATHTERGDLETALLAHVRTAAQRH